MRRKGVLAAIALAILAIAISVAVLASRDADGDTGAVETTEWAAAVCTSLSDWRASIAALADVSGAAITPELLEERLDGASTASADLVEELKELGPPAVEEREEVRQGLADIADGIHSSYTALEGRARAALDGQSPGDVLQGVTALLPDFLSLQGQVEETTATLRSASLFGRSSGELERAFAAAESCRQLERDS